MALKDTIKRGIYHIPKWEDFEYMIDELDLHGAAGSGKEAAFNYWSELKDTFCINLRLNFDNKWVYNYASYKYYEEEEGRTPVLFEGVPYKVELL